MIFEIVMPLSFDIEVLMCGLGLNQYELICKGGFKAFS